MHIGINRIDPNHYGTEGVLRGCENDAAAMRQIAESCGFSAQTLLTTDATASNVVGAMSESISRMTAGDMLLVSYAGHGSQVRDVNSDDEDGFDETWCLYDRMLLDDEVGRALAMLPKGSRALVVLDCCHSGTAIRDLAMMREIIQSGEGSSLKKRDVEQALVFRGLPFEIAQQAYQGHYDMYGRVKHALRDVSPIKAAVILLAACQDHETASDGIKNGKFTEVLLNVWSGGAFTGDYSQFHKKVGSGLNGIQTPNLLFDGELDTDFYRSRPFTMTGRPPSSIAVPPTPSPARTPEEILQEIKNKKRGLSDVNALVRWTLEVPRNQIEGLPPEELYNVLGSEGVDAMMRTYLASSAITAPRGLGFEIECKETKEGRVSCGAKFEHSR